MLAIEFEEVNLRIAENQDEYMTLPAYHDPKEGSVTFCFQLNKEEIDQIKESGLIYFKQLTFNNPMQPIVLSTEKEVLISLD